MSPIEKFFRKFLIIFFSGVSALIIIIGIYRVKNTPTIVDAPQPTPDQTQPDNISTSPAKITPPTTTTTPTGAILSFAGKTIQTPYGAVSASIETKDRKLIAVATPHIPNSSPSRYAQPYLIDQALKAGTANIQGVSGATYTSNAFKLSLENALAQAQAKGGQKVVAQPLPAGTVAPTTSIKPAVPFRADDDN